MTGWRDVALDAPNDSPQALQAEIKALLDKRPMRPARLPEILSQANSFVDEFQHLLMAEGGHRPYTSTLIQVGVAVGTMVAMHWKYQHKRSRPPQRYPALYPVIPIPPHPSYPSGHSVQCHIIQHLIAAVFSDSAPLKELVNQTVGALADRISDNREVAGVHFNSDTVAGKILAEGVSPIIIKLPIMDDILKKAREEWADLLPGDPPNPPQPWPNLPVQVANEVLSREAAAATAAAAPTPSTAPASAPGPEG
jgi:acid phosphatase (class A)